MTVSNPASSSGFDIAQAMALSARSVKSRLVFASIFALASLTVIDWRLVAAWLAILMAWELVGRPATDRLLQGRSDDWALHRYAALKSASATIFGALGGLALASGHPLGAIIGVAWLTGTICHTFVYYGANRTVLLATMAPPCVWAATGMIAGFGVSLDALIGFAAVLSTLSGGAIFLIDRKALMAELDRKRVELAVTAEASEAKSQFIATMSHELRTPLNAIIGYSELMTETAQEDGRNSDVADHGRVLGASRHLLTMINEILDISKIDAGGVVLDVSAYNVEIAARDAFDAVRPLAGARNNKLVVDFGGAKFELLHNDKFRLHQCLINLLSNAAKFTKDGQITLRVSREGGLVVFAVTDTGIGIAPDRLDALFQPFVQADASVTRAYGGTGLGLAISRRLARMMGGDVTVQSVLGKGSTFTLTVAAHLSEPRAEAA